MADPLPEIEGKYEILEKLQVGGMGAIYKVRHRLLGDVRAIKVLRPQLVHDDAFQKRFHREARAATRLTHPNIARLYDFSVDETGAAYIVMEFIEGWTLDNLVKHRRLPPVGLALEIARQALRALAHLHTNGVVHRDISPDNLMLTRDVDGRPTVKLIDLGLAKSVTLSSDLITAPGMFVGKFRYAAPEQYQRSEGEGPKLGPTSDLYSFGLVLYELLTGLFPIVGDSAESLMAGHLYQSPRDFDDTDPSQRLPPDLRRSVLRSIAKTPAERYATAEAFMSTLEPIAARFEIDVPETREILELIQRPPGQEESRPSPGSTQSRFDRQFGTEPTPTSETEISRTTPIERPPLGWIERIEARIADGDLEAAREELGRALTLEGESRELVEIRARIDEMDRLPFESRDASGDRSGESSKTAPGAREEELASALTTPLRTVDTPSEEADAAAMEQTEILSLETLRAISQGIPEQATRQVDVRENLERTVKALPAPPPPPPVRREPRIGEPRTADPRFDEMQLENTVLGERGAAAAPAPPGSPVVSVPPSVADSDSGRRFDEVSLTLDPQALEPPAPVEMSLDELPLSASDRAESAEQDPHLGERSGGSRPAAKLLWVALVLVVLFLFIGIGLSRLVPGRSGDADSLESEEIGAARLSTGLAVVDAEPWAEVLSIVDEQGRKRELPSVVHTPLPLELEPGLYRLVLRYPPEDLREEVEVRVAVGERSSKRQVLRDVAAQELVRGLGVASSRALRDSATAFLDGRYDQISKRRAAGNTPREEAALLVLRAAARHALYSRGGEKDAELSRSASEDIREARKVDASVSPVSPLFSPRFRRFFMAAQ